VANMAVLKDMRDQNAFFRAEPPRRSDCSNFRVRQKQGLHLHPWSIRVSNFGIFPVAPRGDAELPKEASVHLIPAACTGHNYGAVQAEVGISAARVPPNWEASC